MDNIGGGKMENRLKEINNGVFFIALFRIFDRHKEIQKEFLEEVEKVKKELGL